MYNRFMDFRLTLLVPLYLSYLAHIIIQHTSLLYKATLIYVVNCNIQYSPFRIFYFEKGRMVGYT